MRLEKLGISSCVVLTLGLEFLSARGSETRGLLSPDKPGGGGGESASYMAYTGMCCWTVYGFRPLCAKQGI